MRTDLLRRFALYFLMGVVISLSFSISLYEILSVLFVLTAVAAMALDRDTRVLRNRWLVFLVVYFAANLLSLIHTQYWDDSLKGLLRVFRLILLGISVIYVVDSEEKFSKVFKCCLLVGFIIGLDGVIQKFTGFELIRQRPMTAYMADFGRVTSSFRHSNDFSAYLSLTIFFFAGILAEAGALKLTGKQKIFCLAGLAALLLCLVWTYCRGAWVGVAVAFFLFALLKRKRSFLVCLAAVLLWAFFLSPPLLQNRFRSLWNPLNGTVTERKILMHESLNMMDKSPWTGLGVNTFSDNAPFFKSKDTYTDVQYAHNGYLQIAVETGIVGLLSFLFLLLSFFTLTLPVFLKRPPGALEAGGFAIVFGVLAFLIHSATDTDLHSLLLVSNLWLSMGLAIAAAEILRRKKTPSAN